MHKFYTRALMCLALVLILASVSVADVTDTKTVVVKAEVPQQNSLSVTVSKIVGSSPWVIKTSIDFGKLIFDDVNSIFVPSDGGYYAVDVGVNSNAPSWTLTHTISSVANGSEKLDNNINVSFMKQSTTNPAGTLIEKVSFASSNNKAYTKATFSSGQWLRVYYGIATGSGDATGVEPIGATKASGTYTGSITLTLTL